MGLLGYFLNRALTFHSQLLVLSVNTQQVSLAGHTVSSSPPPRLVCVGRDEVTEVGFVVVGPPNATLKGPARYTGTTQHNINHHSLLSSAPEYTYSYHTNADVLSLLSPLSFASAYNSSSSYSSFASASASASSSISSFFSSSSADTMTLHSSLKLW